MTLGVLAVVLCAAVLDWLADSRKQRVLQWVATAMLTLSVIAWGFVAGRLGTMAFDVAIAAAFVRFVLLRSERDALAAGAVQVVAALALLGTGKAEVALAANWYTLAADAAQALAVALVAWAAAAAVERSARQQDAALMLVAVGSVLFAVALPSWVAALSPKGGSLGAIIYNDPNIVATFRTVVPLRFESESLKWLALLVGGAAAVTALAGWLFRAARGEFAQVLALSAAVVVVGLVGLSLVAPVRGLIGLTPLAAVFGSSVSVLAQPPITELRAGFLSASPLVASWAALAYLAAFLGRGFEGAAGDPQTAAEPDVALSPSVLSLAVASIFLALLFTSVASHARSGELFLDSKRAALLLGAVASVGSALYLRFTRGEAVMVRSLAVVAALCLGLESVARFA